MKRVVTACVFALIIGGRLTADETPKLSDLQRLTLQNRVLAYQLAQAQLEGYARELQQPGYDLDLSRLEYVKKVAP